MPKITEQKKEQKKSKNTSVEKVPAVKEGNEVLKQSQLLSEYRQQDKKTVYRVFECICHLEVALQQLKAVGVFPGPEERANALKTAHTLAVVPLETLLKKYQELWSEIQK